MSGESRSRRWPAAMRRRVFDRDRGVCAACGLDTEALRRDLMELSPEDKRRREGDLGWPAHRMDYWDADHTTPFAEGGPCDLDNMRTLCLPCHREVTSEYMQTRANGVRPSQRPSKQPRVWDAPAADGDWWVSTRTQAIDCPQCGRDTNDAPGVMAYVKSADIGGIQAKCYPEWPDRGWVVWRQCEHCSWMDWKTEYVTLEQIRRWNVGPWRPMP